MARLKIKKNDNVVVTAGSDKGKTGKVQLVLKKNNKTMLLVSGINLRTVHKKQSHSDQGGRIKIEKPINISNVAFIDPKDNLPTKVGFKFLENGKKVRFSKRSGEIIDN